MKISAYTQNYGVINFDLIYNEEQEQWNVYEDANEAFKDDKIINTFSLDNSEESQEIAKEWVKDYINNNYILKEIGIIY